MMGLQRSARPSPAALVLARAGAIAYVIWALLHFQAAWKVYELGKSMPPGMASGRVLQDAWNLFCFASFAVIGAIGFNWRHDVRGWWINLAVVSATDIGFIAYVLVPGYMPMWPGLLGPIFWVVGLVLSTAAFMVDRKSS